MTAEDTTIIASEAQAHFALWTSSKRMSFFMDVSETLELKQKQHMEAVEKDGGLVIGDSWILTLAPVLREKVKRDSNKRRSYSSTSVVDLLRFARNMAHHYHPLAPEVRAALGPFENLELLGRDLPPSPVTCIRPWTSSGGTPTASGSGASTPNKKPQANHSKTTFRYCIINALQCIVERS